MTHGGDCGARVAEICRRAAELVDPLPGVDDVYEAARLKAAWMPAGRYYLDEARSDARTMILVYREEGRVS